MEVKKEKTFSPEQEDAIKTRDRTLLVSAAAGSGKTTTLTERIIRSLLDTEKPESIQNMLIVTFTNASVYDLKEKISEALSNAASLNPENKRLETELHALDHAKIMTIDSFCAELVRANAERLGISPSFRITETAEAIMLERAVLDALIEAAYSGELLPEIEPTDFEVLCDALTGVKNTSSIVDKFVKLYEKTKSMVEGCSVFSKFANNYLQYSKESVENTPYGAYAINMVKECFAYLPKLLPHYLNPLLESDNDSIVALGYYIQDIADKALALSKAKCTYSELREKIFGFTFQNAPTIRKEKPKVAEDAIGYRQKYKDAITKFKTTVLSYTEEEWQTLYKDMAKYVKVLGTFLEKFSSVYFEQKRKRACLEFSDIERLAYDCLWQDGKLTEVALGYRKLFSSVYIDEYQDVNELQNKIFEAVAPPDARFMVGDIKQSIYGFRSARPEIFADMKKRFPPLSEGYNTESSIFMSNNYRCDEGVVDFVNEVFDGLFGAVKESIGYVDADKLKHAKKYEDFIPEYENAHIYLIPKKEKSGTYEGESEEKEQLSVDAAEADIIAEKIKELINHGSRRDGKKIKPSDIAIILRTRKRFSAYEEALAKRGIAASAAEDKDFFMNKEILLTLALLNSIDNPKKDIYLASLMCSPLYNFTADELYIMKSSSEASTLYDSLLEYQKSNPEFTKLTVFLSELAHYRVLSEGMTIDTLLTRLYHETGLLSLASRQGGKENLHNLYSYARKFEGSLYKGLYNFIAYINNLIERDATIDTGEGNEKDDAAVHIGTIHSAKGLEFPVVFLADSGASIINLDTREKIAFAEDFGISFLLRAPMGLALVNNPLHSVVSDYMNKKFYEEIIRLLYVALTRAKEKLFVVGRCPEDTENYLDTMKLQGSALCNYSIKKFKTYLDMVCATSKRGEIEIFTSAEEKNEDGGGSATHENQTPPPDKASDVHVRDTLKERFSFKYPREHLAVMPEKMSVSRLSPRVLDGTDEETLEEEEKTSVPIPSFVSNVRLDESAKRGIATHNFLQFFDIASLRKDGVVAEINRLKEKGFLSEKSAKLVRVNELVKFEGSELLSAMEKAKNLYREFRFNTRLPAELFATKDENKKLYEGHTVLVQGVIDCLIENADGTLRLVDYKTDRLTKEELENEELARKKLSDAHSLQLSYYALAVEEIFGKKPTRVEVYSLPLGKTVEV